MRVISILLLWLTAGTIALTLYDFGLVRHYWYEDDRGRKYDLITWKGDNLDNAFGYAKGFRFRYSNYRFERSAEARTILIILVLASACGGTMFLVRRFSHSPSAV